MIDGGPCFGQLELKNAESSATVLISRKGHVTVRERRQKKDVNTAENKNGRNADLDNAARKSANGTESAVQGGVSIPASAIGGPDREKNHILREGVPVPFLVELGVMNKEGYVVKARYDKFRQINRYLEFVNDVVPELKKRSDDHSLKIIDFGCGKSYLTFALYHFLHETKGLNVQITGLDLKKDVIADCSRLAQRLGYNDLEFKHGDIADYETSGGVDMVVTLHACDTATDYALYNAIRWNAGVIFCVPCCQHELNKQIRNKELESVLKYGIIKERISALITDAMRAEMLEEQGYKTQILEFIDMEHTPKNLLIRAVRRTGFKSMPVRKDASKYEKLLNDLSAELTLHRLLRQDQF
ncbi:MAG: SAM-dependent methyltransferase [Lachnospiraceae bacterium]|nr:SAM-dependent methyltransferase [Lachnospiraceae bacterium]